MMVRELRKVVHAVRVLRAYNVISAAQKDVLMDNLKADYRDRIIVRKTELQNTIDNPGLTEYPPGASADVKAAVDQYNEPAVGQVVGAQNELDDIAELTSEAAAI